MGRCLGAAFLAGGLPARVSRNVTTVCSVDTRWMSVALGEARGAYKRGEVPVGAVVVNAAGEEISRSSNAVEQFRDASMHAEMRAIRGAMCELGNWRLLGATLYCTLEPCAMCLSLAALARVSRVVYGADDFRLGACGTSIDLVKHPHPYHTFHEVRGGELGDQSAALLRKFFRERRAAKNGGKLGMANSDGRFAPPMRAVPPAPPLQRVVVYSCEQCEELPFAAAAHARSSQATIQLVYVRAALDASTASLSAAAHAIVTLAGEGVNDSKVLSILRTLGVQLIIIRCQGRLAIDVAAATRLGLRLAQPVPNPVPSHAEYALALLLALQRRTPAAFRRTSAGCMARLAPSNSELSHRIIGLVGTASQTSVRLTRMLRAFGAKVLAVDPVPDPQVAASGAQYLKLNRVLAESDALVLDAPLVRGTKHMLGEHALAQCKDGVHVLSIASAHLIDYNALINALHMGKVAAVALDFHDPDITRMYTSHHVLPRPLQILRTIPNVLLSVHQATNTPQALQAVADAVLTTLVQFAHGVPLSHELLERKMPLQPVA